jgi:hypothetical protein
MLVCCRERSGRTVCGRRTTQCLPYSRCSTISVFDVDLCDRDRIYLKELLKKLLCCVMAHSPFATTFEGIEEAVAKGQRDRNRFDSSSRKVTGFGE